MSESNNVTESAVPADKKDFGTPTPAQQEAAYNAALYSLENDEDDDATEAYNADMAALQAKDSAVAETSPDNVTVETPTQAADTTTEK